MTYSNEQFNKLPKWAQEHINRQQIRIVILTEQRDEAYAVVSGGKKTSVYISGHPMEPNLYLPENRTIVFELNDGSKHGEEISVSYVYEIKTDRKYRVAIRSGWNQMKIHPNSSNVIEVESSR